MADLFAKAYVDGNIEHAALLQLVAGAVAGDADGWTVVAETAEIDVLANDDARSNRQEDNLDDFVYFPYALDIEAAATPVPLDDFIKIVSSVMIRLEKEGLRVVVACDWEERLPGGGRLG